MPSALDPRPKPRFRGVSHFYACLLAAVACVVLVVIASSMRARIAASIYGVAQTAMFGMSALYHLPSWRPRVEPWVRRLDHAAIFVFIAASYTPFCVLGLSDDHARMLLWIVWIFTAIGLLRTLFWIEAPPWVCAAIYVAQGWIVVPYLPHLGAAIGAANIALVLIGGLCCMVGAIVFSLRRPDPAPAVFGYHEIFHLLVIAGCACIFSAVARLVAA